MVLTYSPVIVPLLFMLIFLISIQE